MAISLKTHKMLWGRAAARCSFQNCRIPLAEDGAGVLGEISHIVADSEDGPRGRDPLRLERRDEYDNLILLCPNHHTEIDKIKPEAYDKTRLFEMKAQHESWVRDTLDTTDAAKEADDEYYAELIDDWGKRAHLDTWTAWSSWVIDSASPKMPEELDDELSNLREWLLSRIWPKRYPGLEGAIENFRRVLQDFQEVFHEHAISRRNVLVTEQFYRLPGWNSELYDHLLKKYKRHILLLGDLMLELTRAANYVCDETRKQISRRFRLREGHLFVEIERKVPEYSETERSSLIPYPGIRQFEAEIRFKRDLCLGGPPRE